ncbi:endonuclease V [Pendulispora brunnea]|uniref:Endonuclease V n=1 Tax=Pendulispora brunnea TaxID=2905690 RepID=A0ABZ2K2K9_9BACT
MFCAVDVQYENGIARAACVQFQEWTSVASAAEHVVEVAEVAPYVPGEFFKRELPPLLRVLEAAGALPTLVIVDGYVWLDTAGRPGLGAHLHEALGGRVAVVGVAKTAFRGETGAAQVLRGESAKPLLVSAVGIPLDEAADGVRRMAGDHRIPALLKRVDHLARGLLGAGA